MRYEVDARMAPRSWAAFDSFEGPEAKQGALELARSFARQGFGWVRVLQSSPYLGGAERTIWERGAEL